MNFNSGSLFIFILFMAVLVALLVLLIVLFTKSRKGQKVAVALKIVTLMLAITSIAGCFVFPLTYYGDIPLNLRYGTYLVYEGYSRYALGMKIHRDSLTLHKSSSEKLDGHYTIKNNILEIKYSDGSTQRFVVKGFGSELVEESTNIKAFHYIGDENL